MALGELLHADVTGRIADGFYRVYRAHGHGFVESVYTRSMAVALDRMGLRVRREVPAQVIYEGVVVGSFRFDLLVENKVIVELKCASLLQPIDRKQLTNYLKASEYEVGMLLNFGATPEFKRLVYSNAVKARRPPEVV